MNQFYKLGCVEITTKTSVGQLCFRIRLILEKIETSVLHHHEEELFSIRLMLHLSERQNRQFHAISIFHTNLSDAVQNININKEVSLVFLIVVSDLPTI